MAKRITMMVPILVVAASLVHGNEVSVNPGARNPAAAAPAASSAAGAGFMASRLLTESVDVQLAAMRRRMLINANRKGPFGFFQDPEEAAKMPDIPPPGTVITKKVTPFNDVVQAVPVSVVIPFAQEFVVNSRTIKTGDEFPLELGSETISVRIMRVRNSGVLFKNLKTGELAEKKMEFLPEGVIESRGGQILPEGVDPMGKGTNQKLVIDPANIKPTTNGGSR